MNEDAADEREVDSVMAELKDAYRSDPWYRQELTKLANGWAEIKEMEEAA